MLAALEPQLRGRVRCIYIDPPYNNQEEYLHYTDKLDHEEWLADITIRLKLLEPLMAKNGSLWISIDDTELHYLKVAADQVLGRDRFVATVVWEHRTSRENRNIFSHNHEYILVYASDPPEFKAFRQGLPASGDALARYKNPDKDPRGPWQSVTATAQAGHSTSAQFYVLSAPNGRRHSPPRGRCWLYSKERMKREVASHNVWFGKDGNGVPRLKKHILGRQLRVTPPTLWAASEVGTTQQAKKEFLALFPTSPVFETPKPERLIRRILMVATRPGDLVLDAYLGSGTTCAVAHKMSRRYVGIERGPRAAALCSKRLRRVVSGEKGGISPDVSWLGGGGFGFYEFKAS
ncbi:MAG: site-specific DNA-methyltransferase [Anaerolineales bacterium]